MCLKSHVWTNVFTGAAFVSLMLSITRHSSLRRGGGGLGRGGGRGHYAHAWVRRQKKVCVPKICLQLRHLVNFKPGQKVGHTVQTRVPHASCVPASLGEPALFTTCLIWLAAFNVVGSMDPAYATAHTSPREGSQFDLKFQFFISTPGPATVAFMMCRVPI